MDSMDHTMKYDVRKDGVDKKSNDVIVEVYEALLDKGYNPINQMVGYLLSGDPAYIPRYNNARNIIRKVERDELIEELVRAYINQNHK